jgi:excisionase family DNA binding protein
MSDAREEYLTFDEAADIVRCTSAALRERWRRYRLPVVRFGRRRVLIARATLMAHLRELAVR